MKVFIRTISPAYIETTTQDSSTKELVIDFYVVEYDLHFNRMNVVNGKTVVPPEIDNIKEMQNNVYKQIQKGLNAKD